jgi:hypothetical protein
MIEILEEIIRNPETNATARCTAIRTLREFPQHLEAEFDDLYPEDLEEIIRRKGRAAKHN